MIGGQSQLLVLTSLWDVQTLSVGGLSVRLPFIWRPSLRSRYRMLGSTMMAVMLMEVKILGRNWSDGNGWVVGQAALHMETLTEKQVK